MERADRSSSLYIYTWWPCGDHPAPPMRWGSGQGTIVWRWRVWGWVGRDSDRLSCAARTRLAAALASAQTKERWPPSIHFNSHVQTQRRTRPQWWGRGWGGCRPARRRYWWRMDKWGPRGMFGCRVLLCYFATGSLFLGLNISHDPNTSLSSHFMTCR